MKLVQFFVQCVVGFALLASANAFGQVVQLPAYRNFSYTGGAWVPDQGTAALGGSTYNRSSAVGSGYGPYAPRSTSNSGGASSVTASVTIIDLDALDQAMLRTPSAGLSNSQTSTNANLGPLAPSSVRNTQASSASGSASNAPSRTVGGGRKLINASQTYRSDPGIVTRDPNAYVRAMYGHESKLKTAAVPSQVDEDVRYFITQGQKAEDAGRLVAARVYYRMAMEAMPPELLARYQRIMEQRRKAKEQQSKETSRPGSIRF